MDNRSSPPPELAPTFLSLKAFYAALVAAVFGVSAFLALLLADSGLANLRHDRTLLGVGLIVAGLFILTVGTLLLIPALAQLRLAIPQETYLRLKEGDKVKVRCLPRDTSIARLENLD